jgi:hypothetical protein
VANERPPIPADTSPPLLSCHHGILREQCASRDADPLCRDHLLTNALLSSTADDSFAVDRQNLTQVWCDVNGREVRRTRTSMELPHILSQYTYMRAKRLFALEHI